MRDALQDRYETTDGSRPAASLVRAELGGAEPLVAFSILSGGDAFERLSGSSCADALARAKAYIDRHVTIHLNGAPVASGERVRRDLLRQLGGNGHLVARLMAQKTLRVDVVPAGQSFAALGFPAVVARHVAGVFWNAPQWPQARIGLLATHLNTDSALVFHEMAHAVHYLAFTQHERDLIYRLLRPAFGSLSAMDEAFAIYSEREFAGQFTDQSKGVAGVYGWTRQRWSEDHVFTRFVRKLYFPHKRLAGPGMAPGSQKPGLLPRLPRSSH